MPHNSEGVGYKAEGTSETAADEVARSVTFWRMMVLQDLTIYGSGTADEIADRLNASPLSIRPRVSELHKAGKVRDTGIRRKNASGKSASVWTLAA